MGEKSCMDCVFDNEDVNGPLAPECANCVVVTKTHFKEKSPRRGQTTIPEVEKP